MNYIEITRAEAKERYNKGEKVYAMPCKLTPYGYWGSPLTLDKAKFDELGARFDEVVNTYAVVGCNKIVGEKLKFYRAEREHITEAREKVKFYKLEVEGALKAQKYWENEAQSCWENFDNKEN